MDEHQPSAKYDLAETCCASISIDELLQISENKETKVTDILNTSNIQHYGEIRGSSALRNNLSRLYSSKVGTRLPPENILITPGAIAANHLVFYALIEKDDHVICHWPTYQQLFTIPESFGATVDKWQSKPGNDWLPDIEELKAMVKENTKMIVLKLVTPSPSAISHTLTSSTAIHRIRLEPFSQDHY